MCGATEDTPDRGDQKRGLSPRVRGNLNLSQRAAVLSGPIPACAGQPSKGGLCQSARRAYPRVCGATFTNNTIANRGGGLSPRVRGNRACGVQGVPPAGPIPACAGQPGQVNIFLLQIGAYPRVCGATSAAACVGAGYQGLSPRVRGNQGGVVEIGWRLGPIPACAGQPCRRARSAAHVWAYPRVCGATVAVHIFLCCQHGLSPRVRGNRVRSSLRALLLGPIPACAGQPAHNFSGSTAFKAYPRVCGATICFQPNSSPAGGLSPRVRGNLALYAARCHLPGPIPACAGQP